MWGGSATKRWSARDRCHRRLMSPGEWEAAAGSTVGPPKPPSGRLCCQGRARGHRTSGYGHAAAGATMPVDWAAVPTGRAAPPSALGESPRRQMQATSRRRRWGGDHRRRRSPAAHA
jgi:hypothetical protein